MIKTEERVDRQRTGLRQILERLSPLERKIVRSNQFVLQSYIAVASVQRKMHQEVNLITAYNDMTAQC
jgi:hypothetical protein